MTLAVNFCYVKQQNTNLLVHRKHLIAFEKYKQRRQSHRSLAIFVGLKGTAMQTEKALIHDRLRVSKVF